MMRDITTLGRSFLLSFSGEGVQSGFHFGLNLVLIRVLSAYDFGVFAIAFVLGGISLTYGNALISVPATIELPRRKSSRAFDYFDVVFGTIALLISAAIGIIVAAGLWLTIGSGGEAVAGGAFVGTWTLRNHIRSVMFARQAAAAATLSHLSYSASAIALIATPSLFGRVPDVASVLTALTVGNLVGSYLPLRLTHRRMRFSFRKDMGRRYWKIWRDVTWSLFGTTTWNIQGQGLMFLVTSFVGPAAYAPIAAATVLFNPLRPAVSAFVSVFRTDFVHALVARRFRHLTVVSYGVAGAIIFGCAVIGIVIWYAWPYLDAHIFGDKFADASMPLILALSGLSATIYLTYTVPLILLQAAGQFKAVAMATATGALVGLVSIWILLAKFSVAWSLLGSVAGELACGIYLTIAALRVLRETSRSADYCAPALHSAKELRASP
jgi:O-antigen/teichoic acid export membrane protein